MLIIIADDPTRDKIQYIEKYWNKFVIIIERITLILWNKGAESIPANASKKLPSLSIYMCVFFNIDILIPISIENFNLS